METTLSIIAIVISVISGGFTFYTFFWTARRDRKQATLDAYNQLQEQALDQLNQYTPANIREIANDRRSAEYKTISAYDHDRWAIRFGSPQGRGKAGAEWSGSGRD